MVTAELYPPIKLEITAEKQEDGQWKLHYKEWCPPDKPEAFKNTVTIAKAAADKIPNMELQFSNQCSLIVIDYTDTQERVFDILTGEFLSLSGLGKTPLRDLLVKATLGLMALEHLKGLKEKSKNVEMQ